MKEQCDGKQDAEVTVPLLPDVEYLADPGPRGASLTSAVFNISTSMIGAGIMSIPATFKVMGVLPALMVILVVAFLGDITGEILLRYTRNGKSTTYASLMAESFGRYGSLVLQICVAVTSIGCLIIYLIIIADVLAGNQSGDTSHTGILQEWFGFHWWTSRAFALLITVILVLLPLVLFRRVDSLRYTSAISVFLAFVFVAISSSMAIYALCNGTSETLRLLPDFSSQDSIFSVFTAIPIFMTAFGFQINIHPIRAELHKPSDMRLAIKIALVICAVFYFLIGFFGYLLFGDSIMADMLLNFDKKAVTATGLIINQFIRLSYAFHLMLGFPLLNYALRANVGELFFPSGSHTSLETRRFLCLTCGLLALTYVIAIAIPNIWYCFQALGSTTVVCVTYVFPASIVLRDIHGISTKSDKAVAVLLLVVAVGTAVIGTLANLYS